MATPEGPLNGANLAFVESLFAAYLSDPSSVSADWQAYFAALEPAPNGAFGPLRSTPGLFERRAPSGPAQDVLRVHRRAVHAHRRPREIKNWLQQRMESTLNRLELTRDEQVRVLLTKLTDAEIFEQFIHKKFLGAKRFSLEGGESLIPLIDLALELAGEQGVTEASSAWRTAGA
jgi:2-oxoglutarate dehydrogenase complex dehydrogenase (E1) component-like enzyme